MTTDIAWPDDPIPSALTEAELALLNGSAKSAKSAESGQPVGFPRIPRFPRNDEWNPPRLEEAAKHGLAWRWAEAMQPYTEASPAGMLAVSLTAFGNAIGRTPYVQVGYTTHHGNESLLIVGPTATGRKGEAVRTGMRPIELADGEWSERVRGGFGSGEAVVADVRDETDDEGGADDKRLLVQEHEFASVLAVAGRDGSTLSGLLRNAWDGNRLENRTKARKVVATNAHVSVVAAITPDEMLRRVPAAELANGFLNRFLIVAVYRSRLLPEPPPIPGSLEDEYVTAFTQALTHARRVGRLERDDEARELWRYAYEHELSVDRFGLAGAVCSRAEAHTLRLSMLYALLDESAVVKRAHLEAALALWRYCEQSALLVFGDRLGDPIADQIVDALHESAEHGLTRDELRKTFSNHKSAAELDRALALLLELGKIVARVEPTGGRPVTRYWLGEHAAA